MNWGWFIGLIGAVFGGIALYIKKLKDDIQAARKAELKALVSVSESELRQGLDAIDRATEREAKAAEERARHDAENLDWDSLINRKNKLDN